MSDLIAKIAVLETEMKNISEKVDEGFTINSSEHKEIVKLFNDAMEKKAGKWVEKVIIAIASSVGLSILGALMGLILIK